MFTKIYGVTRRQWVSCHVRATWNGTVLWSRLTAGMQQGYWTGLVSWDTRANVSMTSRISQRNVTHVSFPIEPKPLNEKTMPSLGFARIVKCIVEVWEWISYFIPHFTAHVITYPWCNLRLRLMGLIHTCHWGIYRNSPSDIIVLPVDGFGSLRNDI